MVPFWAPCPHITRCAGPFVFRMIRPPPPCRRQRGVPGRRPGARPLVSESRQRPCGCRPGSSVVEESREAQTAAASWAPGGGTPPPRAGWVDRAEEGEQGEAVVHSGPPQGPLDKPSRFPWASVTRQWMARADDKVAGAGAERIQSRSWLPVLNVVIGRVTVTRRVVTTAALRWAPEHITPCLSSLPPRWPSCPS